MKMKKYIITTLIVLLLTTSISTISSARLIGSLSSNDGLVEDSGSI